MRPNYKVPPIITAVAIAAGLFASAVTGDEARASDRTACAKEISAEVAPERG
ncbi:hypothetical protein PGB28_02660 [Primorskyibacter aestuariivivens]|uniref:hypothetical protein n=1 Tax=Primorskyibacter aestuariivivens TaxID=1888912 RepID=UPI002301EB86|nr:hypothetical protein [Primorskyibacter aestuariivivens]MDA7427345.1 hypothetical protein [Primorskyibacter aestuariivivens]